MMGAEDTRAHCTDDTHSHNWPETAPCQELGAQEVNGVRHQTPQVAIGGTTFKQGLNAQSNKDRGHS